MTRKFIILLLFITSFAVFSAETDKEQVIRRRVRHSGNLIIPDKTDIVTEVGEETLSREQQLIFGLVVINGRYNALEEGGYSYYLRELLNVTGFSADEAKIIFENFKRNPEKYLSVLEKIKQNLVVNYE